MLHAWSILLPCFLILCTIPCICLCLLLFLRHKPVVVSPSSSESVSMSQSCKALGTVKFGWLFRVIYWSCRRASISFNLDSMLSTHDLAVAPSIHPRQHFQKITLSLSLSWASECLLSGATGPPEGPGQSVFTKSINLQPWNGIFAASRACCSCF